jgi:hypothetical protein
MNGVGVAVIEDPYTEPARIDREGNLDVGARLEQAHHGDGTIAEGAPGWTPPKRPLVTVVTALRDDPLGRMFARRQVDRAQFDAGRAYQFLCDTAELLSLRSIDPARTRVSGGRIPEPITDKSQRAAKKLREVDEKLVGRYGEEGLTISRGVLADRKSLETVAKEHGAESERDMRSVGWLFRKCLDQIAHRLGLISSYALTHRRRKARLEDLQAPAADPARHARAVELGDPELRRGRSG